MLQKPSLDCTTDFFITGQEELCHRCGNVLENLLCILLSGKVDKPDFEFASGLLPGQRDIFVWVIENAPEEVPSDKDTRLAIFELRVDSVPGLFGESIQEGECFDISRLSNPLAYSTSLNRTA